MKEGVIIRKRDYQMNNQGEKGKKEKKKKEEGKDTRRK